MMASIAERDSLGRTPLHRAAEKDDLEAARLLIAEGAEIDAKDDGDRTPLHAAVAFENLAIVNLLIEKDANVDAEDTKIRTPLHYAVKFGNLEITRLLIEKGANVDAEDRYLRTPLHYATKDGKLEIARLLIEKGANVNADSDRDSMTPLEYAAKYGKLEIARLLIEKGANIDALNTFGKNALHYAAEYGKLEIAWLLIEKGADVTIKDSNDKLFWEYVKEEDFRKEMKALYELRRLGGGAKDSLGRTPLHKAAENDYLKTARLLIEKGANVKAGDINGDTPLHLVATGEGGFQIARLLINAGADVNAKNKNGVSPLHKAVEKERLNFVIFLIDAGANLEARDNDGETPLFSATFFGKSKLAKLLIEKGAKVDAVDKNGRTPLYLAVQRGSLESAKVLIDAGADVNLGQPLLEVAAVGNVAIARLLVENGADMNARQSSTGKTALHYAVEYGEPEFVLFLVKNGADVTIKDNDGKLFWEYAEEEHEDFREEMEALYERYRLSDRAKKLSELRVSGGSSKEIEELSKMSDKEFEELVGKRAMDKCTNDMDHLFLGTWEASDFRNTVFLRVTDKFGKQRTYCMVERFYEGEEYRGKRTPDIDANISSAFKDIFFSDWVYKYDAGSEAELREMRKVMEEERELIDKKIDNLIEKMVWIKADLKKFKRDIAENSSFFYNSTKYLKLVEDMEKRKKELEKVEDDARELVSIRNDRVTVNILLKKSNRTAKEEAELLELGKRFNGLSDKEHKAGDAYSSADAYGRSGKAGRPGKKRYVVIKLTNGVDFYVEWDNLLKKFVKRERVYVDDENYRGGRREADVTSFKLPDKWSLPIAIYIRQEEEPVAIGNEQGSRGSSETHGNKVVSVYKVRRIVNFETYDSIDRQRECFGEDCGLLHKAIGSREPEEDLYYTVKRLIEKGEDVNQEYDYEYPLHVAVKKQLLSVTRLLLEKGANVNALDYGNHTALHFACGIENINIVKLLIEFGADLNIQDSNGWTALHIAADIKSYEIAELLIRKGADPNIENEYGETFFDLVPDVKVRERMEKVFAEVRGTKRKRRPADSLSDGVDKLKF